MRRIKWEIWFEPMLHLLVNRKKCILFMVVG